MNSKQRLCWSIVSKKQQLNTELWMLCRRGRITAYKREVWLCGFQQDTSDSEEEDNKSNSTDSEDEDDESSASTDSEDEDDDDEVRI